MWSGLQRQNVSSKHIRDLTWENANNIPYKEKVNENTNDKGNIAND